MRADRVAIASTCTRSTSSIWPDSRSSSVSPTQAITRRPVLERGDRAARDGLVGLAEVLPPLGVADDRARDAELEQHRRRDLARVGALVGPVHVLGEDRCGRSRPRPASETKGGQSTASTPSGASKAAQNSRVSRGPLNIFQLPAISFMRSGITATPGSSLPSSSSSAAPPPVEAHETRSTQAELVQRADRVGAADDRERVRARDRLGDRLRALGEARPLEDAHRAVPEDRLRRARSRRRSARASPGRCRARASPPGSSSYGHDLRLGVLGSNAAGGDDVDRQLDLEAERDPSRSSSAILPPTSTVSALPPRLRSTPSLSSTFAPPETSTNGRSTSPSSLPELARARARAAAPRRPAAARRRRPSRRARGAPSRRRPGRTGRSRPRACARTPGRSSSRRGRSACSRARRSARRAAARAAAWRTGRHRERRVRPLRPAEVRADRDLLRVVLEQVLERRQRGADARVVGDAAVLERHVQVARARARACRRRRPRGPSAAYALNCGRQRRADLRHEVDEPARVAPLVVVPAEDLDHVPVHHRQLAVEDRRVRRVLDVGRDERLVGVAAGSPRTGRCRPSSGRAR